MDAGGGATFGGATIDIQGTSGFSMQGQASDGPTPPAFCSPCVPGDTISLSATMNSLNGTVLHGGSTHEFSFTRGDGGQFEFEAPLFALPRAPSTPMDFTFQSPFTFHGNASFQLDEVLSFAPSGSGLATGRFTVFPLADAPGGQQFVLNSLRFEFGDAAAPVPEPGSLLLFGSGVAGALVRARRRRHAVVGQTRG